MLKLTYSDIYKNVIVVWYHIGKNYIRIVILILTYSVIYALGDYLFYKIIMLYYNISYTIFSNIVKINDGLMLNEKVYILYIRGLVCWFATNTRDRKMLTKSAVYINSKKTEIQNICFLLVRVYLIILQIVSELHTTYNDRLRNTYNYFIKIS